MTSYSRDVRPADTASLREYGPESSRMEASIGAACRCAPGLQAVKFGFADICGWMATCVYVHSSTFRSATDSLTPGGQPNRFCIRGPNIDTRIFGPSPKEMPPATFIELVCQK